MRTLCKSLCMSLCISLFAAGTLYAATTTKIGCERVSGDVPIHA